MVIATTVNTAGKYLGEDFKRPWPPLIKVDEVVKAKVEEILNLKPR